MEKEKTPREEILIFFQTFSTLVLISVRIKSTELFKIHSNVFQPRVCSVKS